MPNFAGSSCSVAFEPGQGAPTATTFPARIDWRTHGDPGIRYFLGAATYTRPITVDAAMVAPGRRLYLDLGKIDILTRVSIDGREIATAWKPPYRIDLTGNIGAGVCTLKIDVVNLWVNRLIGDQQPGVRPITYAPQATYHAGSPLLPSGLIGPVALVSDTEPQPTLLQRR